VRSTLDARGRAGVASVGRRHAARSYVHRSPPRGPAPARGTAGYAQARRRLVNASARGAFLGSNLRRTRHDTAMLTQNAAIAANRFGLGARPRDAAAIGSDPKGWL